MNVIFNTNDLAKKELYETGFKMSYDDVKFVSSSNNESDNLTLSVSESLYIDGLDENSQPGFYYDKIKSISPNGKEEYKTLSDEEIINHYSNIVDSLGGKANAKFVDNVKIGFKGKIIKEFKVEKPCVFTSNASKVIKKGSPLNSITLIPEFGDIYKSECDDNEEELLFETRDKKAINTIAKEVNDIKDFLHNEIN